MSELTISPELTGLVSATAETSTGSSFPPAAAGESTVARAAPPATQGTAGTSPMAPKAAAGGRTSRRSGRKRSTKRGKSRAQRSEREGGKPLTAPAHVLIACQGLAGMTDPPAEILYLRGPGTLQTARHERELDSGCWLLVRWPLEGEKADGRMAEYAVSKTAGSFPYNDPAYEQAGTYADEEQTRMEQAEPEAAPAEGAQP